MHMVFGVINQSERRNGAGLQAEIFIHTLWRSKRQFALMKAFFKVVYVEVAFTVKHHKIVAVAFVIAKKKIFAMF